MTKVIKIFDPKEKPFGWLSNNYRHYMYLDNNEWQTVTNYIYSNMLRTPMYRQLLRTAKVKEVKNLFEQYYQDEIHNTTKISMNEAIKTQFEQNKELADLLISTGEAPIVYVSPNSFLGNGTDNNGNNEYGKSLMQIRHLLRIGYKQKKIDEKQMQKDQTIYNLYLADKGLSDEMQEGNDIKQYMNKSPEEIVNLLGRDKLANITPKRDVILEMAHKNLIPNIMLLVDHPENLVPEIRKKYISQLRQRKLKERKEIILDMYADYLMDKYCKVPADKYTKAKEQNFSKLSWQKKNDYENRLFELFNQGMLSDRLSEAIDQRLLNLRIPTEEEVSETKNMIIEYKDKPLTEDIPYVPANGEPILVYYSDGDEVPDKYKPYLQFSPIAFNGMIKIKGFIVPTISHYIIVSLVAQLPSTNKVKSVRGMQSAYSIILGNPDQPLIGIESFVNPETATLRYDAERDISFVEQIKGFTEIALNKKFEDRILQDVLLMTENNTLVWNDFSDPILGVGPKDLRGDNFVGKYLMYLRDKIKEDRKGETLQNLQEEHITMVLNEDSFMKEWVKMRVRDMCKVLSIMKNYIWAKDEIDTKLNPQFTKTVLDKVYQPCSHIYGSVNLVTAEVPDYFERMVRDCPGFKTVQPETVEIIWKRIAVMIYYLIKHLQNSSIQNIRSVLSKIELLVSNSTKCVSIIPGDDYDNCIASALLNILRGVIEFNKQFSYNVNISENDIKLAASIILNVDVKDEINPVSYTKDDEDDDQEDTDMDQWASQLEADLEASDEDDDEEFFFPDEDDDEDDENEFSPSQNNTPLIIALGEIEEIKDPVEISLLIQGAIETIKTYPISKQVKRNRINFFATQYQN